MPIETIVFDFGGVLVDWNPRYLFRKIVATEEQTEWFLATVCTDEWNLQQDKGRPFADAIELKQEEFPEHKELISLYYERWEEMLGGAIPGSVDVLRELKDKGYKLYGLTNWSAETFPVALKKFHFFSWLDGIVMSGEEKLLKPDAALFTRLLDRYQLRAESCLFIDDNLANVNSADRLGFHAIQFKSASLLRQQLVERKLLPSTASV